jgi:hypothetical protein
MVHKSDIIPGLSKFLDATVLAQYPPTSLKRIAAAGALALYLNRNASIVDSIINNPVISELGVSNAEGMVDIDILKDVYKAEIARAGYLRISFPLLGDVDFTPEDVDVLHRYISEVSPPPPMTGSTMYRTPSYGGNA